MVHAVVSTVLSMAIGTSAAAASLEPVARHAGAGSVRVSAADQQAPVSPQPPPAPASPPAPPPPVARAQAPPDAERERVRARTQAAREARRGPWVYAEADPLTASFAAQSGDLLELANMSGDVVVTGGRGSEGRIVARRKAGGRTEADARALVDQVRIDVTRHPQRVVVRGLPNGRANPYRLDYEITLPDGVGLNLRNVSGSVTLTNVNGDVSVEALSGDIRAQGLTRIRSMRTMSGDISLGASALVVAANIQTVSGDVTATGLKCATLTLGSVSGDVSIKDASGCQRVNVTTVSGDITFNSPAVDGGRYELKTHAGSIVVLTGPKSAGFEFEAQTFKGTIQSEAGQAQTSGAPTRQLTGRVGNGSAFFDLTTFVGDIVIKR